MIKAIVTQHHTILIDISRIHPCKKS